MNALKILQVKVPPAALSGHSVQLECVFSSDGDSIYAVKWYRGVDEFYRYVPAEEPHATVFPLNGIEVDVSSPTQSLPAPIPFKLIYKLIVRPTARSHVRVSIPAAV